jgi:hypothetical protein
MDPAEPGKLMTSSGSTSLADSGHAVYSHSKFIPAVLGRTAYWVLLALSIFGLVTGLTWSIIAFLGSLPSDFTTVTNVGLLFTIFGGVALLTWVAFLVALWYFTSRKHSTPGKHKTTWDLISPVNRRYLKAGLVVKLLAVIGISVTTIIFLSARTETFTHQFSATAFTPTPIGTITTVTAPAGSADVCLATIAALCNANVTYTMDEITAQSYINIQHVTAVLSLVSALAYFMDILNFVWFEASVYKGDEADFEGLKLTNRIEIKPDGRSPVFLYVHQKPTKRGSVGAANDATMFALKLTLIIGGILILALWTFQLLTVGGPSDSLCTWFDTFGGFFMVDISVVWAVVIVLGFILLAILLKDSILMDTTNQQKTKIILTISLLSASAILISVLSGLWLSAHGDITFSIPHAVLCRIHPYWRTYNANKVLESCLLFFGLYIMTELYFTHTNKIGAIKLLQGKEKKKKT